MYQQYILKTDPKVIRWKWNGIVIGYQGIAPYSLNEADWTEVPYIKPKETGRSRPCTGTLKMYNYYLGRGYSPERAATLSNYCS